MPREQRALWIDQHCAGDEPLKRRLLRLLAADDTNRDAALEAPLVARWSEQTPVRVGAFRPIRLIGEGGMGVVFEATQEGTGRSVALKLVRAGLASPTGVQRFTQEASLLARLNHPGIAQIYDAGSTEAVYQDGARAQRLFLAMELVSGASIAEWAAHQRLSQTRRVELVEQVAHAVQHAHQRRVLHRDLKPSNILVDSAGQPKILDFGIGRLLASTGSGGLTITGQILGTAPYMSPEQAAGDVGRVDTRTDVYALGMLLYELLAGEPAFDLRGLSAVAAARRIADEAPPRLATRVPAARGDLDAIVHKAIARDPEARYESAGALAADLRRRLLNLPIEARRPSTLEAAARFVRRHRALVGGLVATMLALAIGVVGMTIFALRAESARRAAHWQSYRLAISAASAGIELGDFGGAREALAAAPPEHRGWEHAHLASRLKPWLLKFEGSTAARGRPCVALEQGRVLSALADGRVGVWSLAHGGWVDTLDLGAAVRTLSHRAHDGLAIAALSSGGAMLLDVGAGRAGDWLTGQDGPAFADVHLDEAGRHWWGCGDQAVVVGRMGTSAPLLRLADSEPGAFFGAALSGDGTRLAVVRRASVQLLEVPGGRVIAEWTISATSVAIAPDGAVLVGDRQRAVHVLSDGFQKETALTGHRLRDIVDVLALPDGRAVSVDAPLGEEDRALRTLRVWDLRGLREIGAVAMPDGLGRVRIAPLPNQRVLTGGAEDTPMLLWTHDAHDATLLGRHDSYAYALAWSPDSRYVASHPFTERNVFVRVWDTVARREAARIPTAGGDHGLMAFSADGARLYLSAGLRPHLRIEAWSVGDWHRVADNVAEESMIADCARARLRLHRSDCFSPDGTTRVRIESVGGRDAAVMRQSGGARPLAGTGRSASFAFSPDGATLALAQATHTQITLLDSRTLAPLRTIAVGLRPRAVAYSPDGRRLAVVGFANVVRLFDTQTWESVVDLRGHTATIHDVRFSPDGRCLATASSDRTVRLWTIPEPAAD